MRALLLTDLDNTLYNWVDFFAPSFRAMVRALGKSARVTEDRLYEDFRAVYRQHATLEYAFAVQELRCLSNLTPETLDGLVDVANGAFIRVRKRNLTPYPGVRETLQWAGKNGVFVVGVTNAHEHHATARLKKIGLSHLFHGLVAQENYEIPENSDRTQAILSKENVGRYLMSWVLSAGQLKPRTTAYKIAMERLGVCPENTYVVGDSQHKDLQPAADLGCKAIWAAYGTRVKPKNLETVLAITPWSARETSDFFSDPKLNLYATLESFSELRQLISPPQDHFGFSL